MGRLHAHWSHPAEFKDVYTSEAIRLGTASGALVYAGFAIVDNTHFAFTRRNLIETEKLVKASLDVMRKTRNSHEISSLYQYLLLIRAHKGRSDALLELDMDQWDKLVCRNNPQDEIVAIYRWFRAYMYQEQLHYLYGNYLQTIRIADKASPFLPETRYLFHQYEPYFYEPLAIGAGWHLLPDDVKRKLGKRIRSNQRLLSIHPFCRRRRIYPE